MKKSLLVAALLAAACSTGFAAEAKQHKTQVPPVKATTMSDADMNKVTAGYSTDNNGANGGGIGFSGMGKGNGAGSNNGNGRF
jgi:hypothetical protein